MTKSRFRWAAVFFLAAAAAGAQSMPTEAGWAVTELSGGSGWAVRLPLMVARNWGTPPVHLLSEDERSALRQTFLDQTRAAALKAASAARLGLARKQLAGTAVPADETSAAKAAAEADVKAADAAAGRTSGAAAPATLPLKPRWPGAAGEKPWPVGSGTLAAGRSSAVFVLAGTVDDLGPALSVRLRLECAWTRTATVWEGVFAPDEAEVQMAAAAAVLLQGLAGAPPAAPEAAPVASASPSAGPLVLETDPPGALLYLDSRYLGPSPQTVDRPKATQRVRVEAGGGGRSWEIGPRSPSPSRFVVGAAPEPRDTPAAKDRFYWSLAAFSAGLTSAAFAGAWSSEQLALAQAYADAGSASGLAAATQRYYGVTALYGASVVLTTGLFVWMMVELGDYLETAQSSLP